jgi:hypothetical protein
MTKILWAGAFALSMIYACIAVTSAIAMSKEQALQECKALYGPGKMGAMNRTRTGMTVQMCVREKMGQK